MALGTARRQNEHPKKHAQAHAHPRPILHYPRLDTVLMVEEYIRAHSGELKKRALWERLPRKMMYGTFQTIFDYLLASGKIACDSEGKICWIWNPRLVKRYLKDASLVAR